MSNRNGHIPNADEVFTRERDTPNGLPPRRKKDEQPASIIVQAVVEDEVQGVVWLGNFGVTALGLAWNQDAEISEAEWIAFNKALAKMDDAIQWVWGDLIAFGETKWGKTYSEVAALTGRDETTLYNYTYVSKHIQFSLRNENLSWQHHKLIAPFSNDPRHQQYWIAKALEYQWSTRTMAAMLDLYPNGLPDGYQLPSPTVKANDPLAKFERVFLPFSAKIDKIARKASGLSKKQIAAMLRKKADELDGDGVGE
jgi:hypothetical protein